MRSFVFYAVTTVTLVVAIGWLLTRAFHGPDDAAAIRLSAVVAIVVQLAAFGAVRLLGPRRVIVGWGIGALLRLATLTVYGLLVVKALIALPMVAALIALASFFFVTTLIEPLLLKL